MFFVTLLSYLLFIYDPFHMDISITIGILTYILRLKLLVKKAYRRQKAIVQKCVPYIQMSS